MAFYGDGKHNEDMEASFDPNKKKKAALSTKGELLQDKLPENITLFVTGTGQRGRMGKNSVLLRSDNHAIHLHPEAHPHIAHALVDRYNSYQSLVDALATITNEFGEWLDAADDQFGRESNEAYQQAVTALNNSK